MKIFRNLLIAASFIYFGFSAYALDDPKVAHAKYDELAAKVNSGDLKIDWQALRLAARVGEVAGDYNLLEANKRGQAAYDNGDFEEALKIAHEIEQHNIADGQAHLLAMHSLIVLGRKGESDKELRILQAFLESITKSGNGKSAKTAWFAVGIQEEFVYIFALQMQFKGQHSVKQDGHYYDVVSVIDQSGKEAVLWFNTDTDIELRVGTEGHPIN